MNAIRGIFAALLVSFSLPAQNSAPTPGPRPEFEVASVKTSPPFDGTRQVNVGVHIDGARLSCTALALKDYLRMAYRIKDHQISGPEWIGSVRYDIAATIPAGVPRDKVPEMMQALLADRFHLTYHKESKEFPVYALVVAKGGPNTKTLKASKVDPDAPAAGAAVNVTGSGGRGGMTIDLGAGSYFTFANNKLEGGRLTMTNFTETLARFVDRPVVDMTELKGMYDLSIEFTPEDYRAMQIRSAVAAGVALPPEVVKSALEGGSGDSMFAAIQSLGLRLERSKAPIEVLVVDRADKTPTEN